MTTDDCTMTSDELWAEVQRLRSALQEIAGSVCGPEFYVDGADGVKHLRSDISPAELVQAFREYEEGLCNSVIEDREIRQRYDEREALVEDLLEAADELGDELYPILITHDFNMRQNYLAAKRVRDFGPCGGGESE
jgi:hypothetical protein